MQTVLMQHWQRDQQLAPAPRINNDNTAKEPANETPASTYAHMDIPIGDESINILYSCRSNYGNAVTGYKFFS